MYMELFSDVITSVLLTVLNIHRYNGTRELGMIKFNGKINFPL